MEGDDLQDPLVDAARSFLDGHIVLSRAMASEGWYPPVDVLESISRLMPAVTTPEHRERAMLIRQLLAAYARSEDLVRIGAYKAGSDPDLDRALAARQKLRAFLEQKPEERSFLRANLQPDAGAADLIGEEFTFMAKALQRILRIRQLAEEQARLEVERAAQRARQVSAACARQVNSRA